jgi:hypothetical protein
LNHAAFYPKIYSFLNEKENFRSHLKTFITPGLTLGDFNKIRPEPERAFLKKTEGEKRWYVCLLLCGGLENCI